MADHTSIEWCDSTLNLWVGCAKISPGCDHCYAEAWAKRSGLVQWGPHAERRRTSQANWRKPEKWNAIPFGECTNCGWRGEVTPCNLACACEKCHAPLKPARRRVFCASLADVFDNQVPVQWREDLFRLIAQTPNLDWLLLTKRIGNALGMIRSVLRSMVCEAGSPSEEPPIWPWPNVRIGATMVNQEEWDRDIDKLLALGCFNFVSLEPLLGPIDMRGKRPDWVIVGGESGPGARPMHPDWARSIRDQCAAAGVPFLFKQVGEAVPVETDVDMDHGHTVYPLDDSIVLPGDRYKLHTAPSGQYFVRVPKKAAGRLLDGRTHDEFPEAS